MMPIKALRMRAPSGSVPAPASFPIQKAVKRSSGNMVLGTPPTVGNELYIVAAGWATPINSYAPAGFTLLDQVSVFSNSIKFFKRTVQSGDGTSYAAPAAAEVFCAIYEVSPGLTWGRTAYSNPSAAWTINAPYPPNAKIGFLAVENDNTSAVSVTAETGWTEDINADASTNHRGVIGHSNPLTHDGIYQGTIGSVLYSIAAAWALYQEPVWVAGVGGQLLYTGADQDITIPAGATSVRFEIWGGGGHGGIYGGGIYGGGGGYAAGTLPVTPGDTLKVQVAGGGRHTRLGGWPDGGEGSYGDATGGGGGGSSRIWLNGTLHAVAGGGGGAAGYDGHGGAGGGSSGQNSTTGGGGIGGTQTAGGYDNGAPADTNKKGLSLLAVGAVGRTGGNGGTLGGSTGDDGGAGGGGYWGGGGGGGDAQAGGGGSGFLSGSVVSPVLTQGSGASAPNPNGTKGPNKATGQVSGSTTSSDGYALVYFNY